MGPLLFEMLGALNCWVYENMPLAEEHPDQFYHELEQLIVMVVQRSFREGVFVTQRREPGEN